MPADEADIRARVATLQERYESMIKRCSAGARRRRGDPGRCGLGCPSTRRGEAHHGAAREIRDGRQPRGARQQRVAGRCAGPQRPRRARPSHAEAARSPRPRHHAQCAHVATCSRRQSSVRYACARRNTALTVRSRHPHRGVTPHSLRRNPPSLGSHRGQVRPATAPGDCAGIPTTLREGELDETCPYRDGVGGGAAPAAGVARVSPGDRSGHRAHAAGEPSLDHPRRGARHLHAGGLRARRDGLLSREARRPRGEHELRRFRVGLRRLLSRRLHVHVRWLHLHPAGLRLRVQRTDRERADRQRRLGVPLERQLRAHWRHGLQRRRDGVLPLHGGVHGHHGHDPDGVHGGTVEVEVVRRVGAVLWCHLLPAVRRLDVGRRLAQPAR